MTLILSFLFLALSVNAQFKSNCKPAHKGIIEAPGFSKELLKDSKLQHYDCLDLSPPVTENWFVLVAVLETSAGPETHLVLFDHKNFKGASSLLARSEPLGLDVFPVWTKEGVRLGFILPKVEHDRVGIYVNIQTSPAVTRLSRWDLEIKTKSFFEVINRAWVMDAGVQPKIYDDNGVWRALILQRAAEL